MKAAACLLSTFAATAASLILCCPSFANLPQTLNLTIENHQKLVTVKDDSGKWLFAQVISTSNLEVLGVSLGKDVSRISIQDGTGKTLWSKTANCGIFDVAPHGEWSDKFASVFLPACTSLGWKPSDASPDIHINQLEFVIGSNDQLVTLHVGSVKHKFEITPIKNGFVAKMDESKTVIVLQPPASPAAPTVAQATTP